MFGKENFGKSQKSSHQIKGTHKTDLRIVKIIDIIKS